MRDSAQSTIHVAGKRAHGQLTAAFLVVSLGSCVRCRTLFRKRNLRAFSNVFFRLEAIIEHDTRVIADSRISIRRARKDTPVRLSPCSRHNTTGYTSGTTLTIHNGRISCHVMAQHVSHRKRGSQASPVSDASHAAFTSIGHAVHAVYPDASVAPGT